MEIRSKLGDKLCLFTTYFIARESDLVRCHKRYLERIEQARDVTKILVVTDWIKGEGDEVIFEVMMQDLRRDVRDFGQHPLDESEWGLYSLSCVALDVDEPVMEGEVVSRLVLDLALDGESVPRSFNSRVLSIDLSDDGRGARLGEMSF